LYIHYITNLHTTTSHSGFLLTPIRMTLNDLDILFVIYYIIMKALDGFLMTERVARQVTLKDVCGYVMLKSFIGSVQ